MLGKVVQFCKKSVLRLISAFFPANEDNLELNAFERELERNTQALTKLLRACGLSQAIAHNLALKVLLHDANFNINSSEYANIKYVLKAKAREFQRVDEEVYEPAYSYVCSGVEREVWRSL